MLKKLMALVLIVAMTLSLVPTMGLAVADEFVIDANGVLTEYTGAGGHVVIPEGVKKIGDRVFERNSKVTGVTLPDGLLGIGVAAFSGCEGLAEIEIPDSVKELGRLAFYSCKALKSITLPKSGIKLDEAEAAFYYTAIKTITLPTDMKVIPSSMFEDCDDLSSITIPEGVTTIGNRAFNDCRSLSTITIPSSVTTIGYNAFSVWESDNKTGGLTSINLPDSVTKIGKEAFLGCYELTTVKLPSKLKTIETGMFRDCYKLESIEIPSGVTKIGEAAFQYCSLNSIKIPSGVTSIGERAFHHCTGLSSITIPSSVTSIGFRAFSSCVGLSSVTIPGKVTEIGGKAFFQCDNLTSVKIPASVTSIGLRAFGACPKLKSITVSSKNKKYASSGGVLFNKAKTTLILYPLGKGKSYAIPKTVKKIGAYSFGAEKVRPTLTKITIPASVTTIDEYAFQSQESLTSITLPSKLVTIGKGAFGGTMLKSVKIPKTVKSIGAFAFCMTPPAKLSCTFLGDAPKVGMSAYNDHYESNAATLYYKSGAKGFESPKWKGLYTCYKLTQWISASPRYVPLTKGKTKQITISKSSKSNPELKWTSSNKKVATVSKSGKITAVSKGKATITAETIDGTGKKVTVKVTVK